MTSLASTVRCWRCQVLALPSASHIVQYRLEKHQVVV
jgi:hypothetical protein